MTTQTEIARAPVVRAAERLSSQTQPELPQGKTITLEAFWAGDSWKVDLNGC